MPLVEPSFEIDDKGRVICQYHPNYPFFMMPNKTYFEERKLEILLTCKTCSHYQNNDCYFSKARIDNLEQKRLKKTDYLCKLCGNRIDRMFTIIYKLYFKERYNIDIPLICCNCYDSLKRNEFVSRSKWKIYLILSSIFSTIFFLVYFLTFGLIFSSGFSTTLVFLLIGIILWVIIAIKDLVRLKKVVSGRKYYKRYFINKYYKTKNKK
ncbi:MAG: hypothetical protein ACFFA6_03515 [Promethearchaeota archaeon]